MTQIQCCFDIQVECVHVCDSTHLYLKSYFPIEINTKTINQFQLCVPSSIPAMATGVQYKADVVTRSTVLQLTQ